MMCRKLNVFFVLFIWLDAVKAETISVTVKQGKILGRREATVFDSRLYFAFYSVPYAKPPTGKLRFKNPQPIKKWKATLDARLEYHGACAQTHIVHKDRQYGVEDCLYLNIFTPKLPKSGDTDLIPVVVWIHGYAYASSFSHIHGPDFFISNGIVVVTLTHRIGVYGFLKVRKSDNNANMGIKDIVTALEWIKTNIKKFGGDRNKITLMGCGSGATFISLLMTTHARKLFSKVILQSGSIFSPSIFQSNPETERDRLLQELKRKHLKLSKASTLDILTAAHSIYIRNSKEMIDLQRPLVPFTPMIEKESNTSLLTQTPTDFYISAKSTNIHFKKPILLGYNTQESISEVIPFIHNPYLLKTFVKYFKFMVPFSDGCRYNSSTNIYKQISTIIKGKYFKGTDTVQSLESLLKYASDLITFPILKFVRTHYSLANNKMFMYKFDYRGNLNGVKATSLGEKQVKVSGVASGDEICYLLRCEPYWELYGKMEKEEENKDKDFIKEISLLWSNFVKFGDPTPNNNVNNVTWLPVGNNIKNILLIRKYFKLISPQQENAVYNFWDLLYETYYKKDKCTPKHDEL